MLRMVAGSLVIAASMLLVFGCAEQVNLEDPRFKVDPSQAKLAQETGFEVPDISEVDLVERMAANRAAYRQSLNRLHDYYDRTGNVTRRRWAQREIDSLIQYRYLMPAESAYANLRATDSIEEADELFEDAMKTYRDAGGSGLLIDETKLRIALRKFNKVIETYPNSDKIDDASYRAGRIYEHFHDYQIAATYFQRAFQWSATTPFPARFRAAFIMDQKLRMKKEALVLYRLACEHESRYKTNTEYALRRIDALSKPIELEEPRTPDQQQ